MRTVEVLFFEGCPHARAAVDLARAAVLEAGVAADVREVCVVTEADAARLRFLGSPTVRVDGRDVDPNAQHREGYAMQCRLYARDGVLSGLPAAAWIRDALRGR